MVDRSAETKSCRTPDPELARDLAVAKATTLVEKVERGELEGEEAQSAITEAAALLDAAENASS